MVMINNMEKIIAYPYLFTSLLLWNIPEVWDNYVMRKLNFFAWFSIFDDI